MNIAYADEPQIEPKTISLTLDLPPSANRYWRVMRGRVVKSQDAKDYIEAVGWKCRAAGITPIDGSLCIEIDVYARVTRDLDNSLKGLCDSLNGHLWFDDSQVYQIIARKHAENANQRIEIKVSRIVKP